MFSFLLASFAQHDSTNANNKIKIGKQGIEFKASELIYSRLGFGIFKQIKNVEINAFGSLSIDRNFNKNNQYDFEKYVGLELSYYPIQIKQFNLYPSLQYRYGEYIKSYYINIPRTTPGQAQQGYYNNITYYTNSVEFGANMSLYFPPFFMIKLSGNYGFIFTNEQENMDIIIRANLGIQFRF